MTDNFALDRGTVKIVSGILESHSDDFPDAITVADDYVRQYFESEIQYDKFLRALRLNIINQKKYASDAMIARYGIPLSEPTFRRIKRKYIYIIADELNLTKKKRAL